MTKLMEWLCGVTVYVSVWFWLITEAGQTRLGLQHYADIILLLPVLTVAVFGIYAASVVVWRVYCFNDCPEAAKELQQQIKEAREELRKKGLTI